MAGGGGGGELVCVCLTHSVTNLFNCNFWFQYFMLLLSVLYFVVAVVASCLV